MSFKELSPETLQAITNMAAAIGATGIHFTLVRICDSCQDEEREAFPYYAVDKDGRKWDHLCNDCWELLGCTYDDFEDEEE